MDKERAKWYESLAKVKWAGTLTKDVPIGLRQRIATAVMKIAERIDGKRKYHALFIESTPPLSASDYDECLDFGYAKAFQVMIKLARNESCEQAGMELMPWIFDRSKEKEKEKDQHLVK